MKIILLLLLSLVATTVDAQDYCKRLKKEDMGDKTMFDYSSPFNPQKIPAVRVKRSYSTDPDNPSDNFVIIFQIVGDLDNIYIKTPEGGQTEKDEKKLVVEFDDKSKIVEESIQVSHDVTDDKMQSIRNVYYPLEETNLKDFTTKKITKFSLAGYEQSVPADSATAIQQYVICMKALK